MTEGERPGAEAALRAAKRRLKRDNGILVDANLELRRRVSTLEREKAVLEGDVKVLRADRRRFKRDNGILVNANLELRRQLSAALSKQEGPPRRTAP
jgi:hypothetical protein